MTQDGVESMSARWGAVMSKMSVLASKTAGTGQRSSLH